MSDDELEELRRRRELELKQRLAAQEQQQQQFKAQKTSLLRKILDPDARIRLANIKMVKPEFANQLELQLIQLAQTNQLQRMGFQLPMKDAQFKVLLKQLSGAEKKEKFKIRRI